MILPAPSRWRSSVSTPRGAVRRRGGALLVALVATGAVAVMTIAYLQLTAVTSRSLAGRVDTGNAFYMAEAGLVEGYTGLTLGRTGNVASAASPALLGDGVFWVESNDLGDGRVELTSTGMVGTGKAILSVLVEKEATAVASLGMFSNSPMTIPPGVTIDGYDSRDGTYAEAIAAADGSSGHARVGSNGVVTVQGTLLEPTVVDGDITYGPGGTATIAPESTVTGTCTSAVTSLGLPDIVMPRWELFSGVSYAAEAPLIIPAGKLGAEYLDVTASTVVITGPAALYLGSFSMSGRSTLWFDTTKGPVDLYIQNSLDLDPLVSINTTSEDPYDVTIQVNGANATVDFEPTGAFYGVLYAPDGDVTVGSNVEIFGSVAADTLSFASGATLHYDLGLMSDLDEDAARPELLSWRIVDLGEERAGNVGSDPFQILGIDRSTLAKPVDSHADQQISIKYVDTADVEKTYSGWESNFDWSLVKSTKNLVRDGEIVVVGTEDAIKTAAGLLTKP